MDLGAYANIEDLQQLAEKNGIDMPRCRGYRLMKNEKPISNKEIEDIGNNNALDVINNKYFASEYLGSGIIATCFNEAYDRKRKKYAYIKDEYLSLHRCHNSMDHKHHHNHPKTNLC